MTWTDSGSIEGCVFDVILMKVSNAEDCSNKFLPCTIAMTAKESVCAVEDLISSGAIRVREGQKNPKVHSVSDASLVLEKANAARLHAIFITMLCGPQYTFNSRARQTSLLDDKRYLITSFFLRLFSAE